MEIVCTILKGINVVLREINEKKAPSNELTESDFKEVRDAKLRNISVLNKDYFEDVDASKLRLL